MPGYRVYSQDGGEVRDGLTCSYCKLMLKDPVQTTETGKRFCKGCFEKAKADRNFVLELDPNDEVWPDFAVKREIANLKVKCDNYQGGCDWAGLFKDLMKHLEECQFVTVVCKNPGCGERVLLSELEVHLKDKCLHRQVECKDCDKKMSFIELQEHTELCPNAPKVCKTCKKKIPASQYIQHIREECKHIQCVCKEDDAIFEGGSDKLQIHLEDISKLGNHLAPMITEFSKMSLAFQKMTATNQLLTQRNEELEIRNKVLERNAQESNEKLAIVTEQVAAFEKRCDEKVDTLHRKVEKVDTLEKEVELLKKKQNVQLQKNKEAQVNSFGHPMQEIPRSLEVASNTTSDYSPTLDELESLSPRSDQLPHEVVPITERSQATKSSNAKSYSHIVGQLESLQLQQQQPVAIKQKSACGGKVVPYEKPPSSELVKQVEDKVLEVERTLNVLNVHHSELELQLQASLASTHNGAFLWRIPEVRRRIRDAKIGRITSIYSPPFYTGRNGYKMCIRAYLNGDGTGEGTHLSIFFVLMRGEYDPLLQWPFEPKVSLILVDQDHKKHLVQTFKPNAQSSSFKRPVSDMNVASGCPEFAKLSILDNPSYVKEDVMYIKAIVDTSKIFHP
ncbi:TNF receptor-associated factor 2-like [Dysidea avara]|uniref:TNF receptor-associated factor 2-like n=1 Tax=Dysidea avara TaxID=196820 RepID=UPI0033167607